MSFCGEQLPTAHATALRPVFKPDFGHARVQPRSLAASASSATNAHNAVCASNTVTCARSRRRLMPDPGHERLAFLHPGTLTPRFASTTVLAAFKAWGVDARQALSLAGFVTQLAGYPVSLVNALCFRCSFGDDAPPGTAADALSIWVQLKERSVHHNSVQTKLANLLCNCSFDKQSRAPDQKVCNFSHTESTAGSLIRSICN